MEEATSYGTDIYNGCRMISTFQL